MSAKRIRTILLVTVAQCASVCATTSILAEPTGTAASGAAARTSSAPRVPLTREDVDLILREARNAIQQGRTADAEKLIQRAEGAHINYSMFHVGPTPVTVRRELARAQRSPQANRPAGQKDGTGMSRYLPFNRNGGNGRPSETNDPFIDRTSKSESQAASPSATRLPATRPADVELAGSSERTRAEQPAPPAAPARGETKNNPFAQTARSTDADPATSPTGATRHSPSSPAAYPVTQASTDEKKAWSLPDAPVPAAYAEPRVSPRAPAGLIPPRRDSQTSAASNTQPAGTQPKQQALAKLNAAREALNSGDLDLAERLSRAASELNVPESQFLPNEDRPSLVAWDIVRARQSNQDGQPPAVRAPQTAANSPSLAGSRYSTEPARAQAPPLSSGATLAASSQEVVPAAMPQRVNSPGQAAPAPDSLALPNELPQAVPVETGPQFDGVPRAAATAPSTRIALAPQANTEELPPAEPMTTISDADTALPPEVQATAPDATAADASVASDEAPKSLIDSADAELQVVAKRLSSDVANRQSEALKLLEKDPERAEAILHEAQQLVNDSKLPESSRRELLARIDRTMEKVEKFAKANGAQIALDKANDKVLADRDRDQEMKLKKQQKMAELIEQFNQLRDEQRFAEMEIIAKRLIELAPDDPVAQQVMSSSKFIRREMLNRQVANDRENGNWEQLYATERAMTNPVAKDGEELRFDQKYWDQFAKNRQGSKERVERRTEREMEIERRMKTPVLLKYSETPLGQVIDSLSQLTGVNIHLDPRGLSQEGINSETPITISLAQEISLKSALNLILEPLHLSYVINDEVLKITSEQLRDGETYPLTYNVADLVTPIPNFVPSNNIGLQGLINDAQASAGGRGSFQMGNSAPSVLVNDRKQNSASATDQILAQQFNAAPATGASPSTVPIGAGPGGLGGAANADFDSLIDLIVSTVQTDTWAENGGGEAEIRPFPTNLSLVISQTQAVHEEIADLLAQLRRLQDLQVTIEVRFIRLNDSFFERIGIDFDMNVEDRGVDSNQTLPAGTTFEPAGRRSNTVGLLPAAGLNVFPNYTTDLDIPFRQNSFDVTRLVPFGGPVDGGLQFGFAILSDIEAFFLIEAAQGDTRTNVLNAPKVTLFNGQQAFVADATQRPFVVGVIPVVGEFAAAQQPVIVVLNEGTMMTIQAVVSDDRRYVRMTIVPFFTQIGDVDTFTFEGSSSSTNSSSATDDDDDGKNESEEESDEETRSGVTVQLPSFSFVSVVTTVSVPDGGTVLLGGIKRLSEGRQEFGVPLLSKVPYVNRLFRNIGIGRETDSLMMMVTPRIIIQEEEEERLGIATQTP